MAVLTLDDRDPSIVYSTSPAWSQDGVAVEYNSTTTFANQPRMTAQMKFRGTSVAVYGTISARGRGSVAPVSIYRVDNGPIATFTAKQASKPQFSQLFFQSETLDDGPHTLSIMNTLQSDPLFIDFYLVDMPSGGSLPNTSTSTSGSSSSSSSTSKSVSTSSTTSTVTPVTITVTSIPTTSASRTDTVADPSGSSLGSATGAGANNSKNTGAIAGGIIGAVLILFIIAAGFLFWRRRQRNKRNSMSRISTYWGPPAVPPKAVIDQSPGPGARTLPMAQTSTVMGTQGSSYNAYPSQWQGQSDANAYPSQGGYPSPNVDDAYAQDAYITEPTYPHGGYTPSGGYASQGMYGQPQGSTVEYASSRQAQAYAQQPQPARGYAPPSQLLREGADYNRGMPAPTGAGYNEYRGNGRPRIRLDE